MVIFIQPLSMVSFLLFFLVMLIIIIQLTYFFTKRKRIWELRRMSTIFIVGFPNSGRSFIMRNLSGSNEGFLDKILNISYIDIVYNGRTAIKILDHEGVFSIEGKINDVFMRDVKAIDPECIVAVIDVSWFSPPIENQIQFILKMKEEFKGKKFFVVANKVDKTSKEKLRRIERVFGKKYYKIRINHPEDVEKLKRDLMEFLTKGGKSHI